MSVALIGMHVFGVTGDLMSLGAIDFGFLVDGPIVMLEAVIAGTAGRSLFGLARRRAYTELAARVVRPVGFAVAIIMLVYLPLLSLQGIEGKMFRPMAITMACALFGALVFAVAVFPALVATVVRPPKKHGARGFDAVARVLEKVIGRALRLRWLVIGAATLLLVLSGALFARTGANFVPRI